MSIETIIIIAAVVVALIYFASTHKASFAGLTAKLEGIEKQLGLIHTTANAPVTVALVPAQAPAAQSVTTTTTVTPAPAMLVATKVDDSNPFVAWKAAGLDIWTVMTRQHLNRALTEADWVQALAAGYTRPEALQPSPTPAPSVDPYIFGDRFDFARPGVYLRTKGPATRALPIPADFKGFVRLEVVPNSDTQQSGPVTYSVNGDSQPFPNQSFGTGPFAVLAVGVPAAPNEIPVSAGDVSIAISVACDLTFRAMPA